MVFVFELVVETICFQNSRLFIHVKASYWIYRMIHLGVKFESRMRKMKTDEI